MPNKKRLHEYRGMTGTAQELIDKFGAPVSERGIYRRLLTGMTIDEAMTKPVVQTTNIKHLYVIDGINACLPDHARRYGIVSTSTAKWRVASGWSVEDAIKTPPLSLEETHKRSRAKQAKQKAMRDAGLAPPLRESKVRRRGESRAGMKQKRTAPRKPRVRQSQKQKVQRVAAAAVVKSFDVPQEPCLKIKIENRLIDLEARKDIYDVWGPEEA